tara:strand:- start:296 stop:409 length:114 start_codon:yes stop_codon:yes gene_type:complete
MQIIDKKKVSLKKCFPIGFLDTILVCIFASLFAKIQE